MDEEPPICHVSKRLIIARRTMNSAGTETLLADEVSPAENDPPTGVLELRLVSFASGEAPLQATVERLELGIPWHGPDVLPSMLVELLLEQSADLCWVAARWQWPDPALAELRSVAEAEPMAGLIRVRCFEDEEYPPPRILQQRDRRALELWSNHLPRVRFVSRPGNACVYLKLGVVREFWRKAADLAGVELAALAQSANRCGFLVAMANRAFVSGAWRSQGSNLPDQPMTAGLLALSLHERENRVESLLAGLVPDDEGRLGLALDFTALVAAHNGTAVVGLNLARQLVALARESRKYRIVAIARPEVARFHQLADQLGVEVYEPERVPPQAAVIRPSQPFGWEDVAIPSLTGVVTIFYMLDTIAWDCANIRIARFEPLWNFVFRHASGVVYISDFTKKQFESRFVAAVKAHHQVSLLSLDLCDYLKPAGGADRPAFRSSLLVIGNRYDHKGLYSVLEPLTQLSEHMRINIVGAAPQGWSGGECYPSGHLPDAEFARLLDSAAWVVFPSYDEGFGLPVLEALAHGCRVLVRDIPVFRELFRAMGCPPEIQFFTASDRVATTIRGDLAPGGSMGTPAPGTRFRSWRTVAEELLAMLENRLDDPNHAATLHERLQSLGSLESLLLPAQFLLSIDRSDLVRESVRWFLDRQRKRPSPWFRALCSGRRMLRRSSRT